MSEDQIQQIINSNINKISLSFTSDNIEIKQEDEFNHLIINRKFYSEHKDLLDNVIKKIIISSKNREMTIAYGSLINDNLINSLCENDNIKIISLAKNNYYERYSLSKSHYDLFKAAKKEKIKTTFVDKELENNFDSLLEYNYEKSLLGFYSYKDLKGDHISLFSKIPEDKLYVLQYLGENTELSISTECNIKEILETLKKYNKTNKVKITADDKDKLNYELKQLGYFGGNDSNINNITVELPFIDRLRLPLNEYLEYEKLLYDMVEPAKNLSPFEKMVYAYDITKKFKKYRMPKKDNKNVVNMSYDEKLKIRSLSRDLYKILDNDYIVCVGFVNLLHDLLSKLGIDSISQSVDIDLARHKSIKQLRDNNKNWKELSPQEKYKLISQQVSYIPKDSFEGHRRLIVRIKDEKYGIDGIYISDPTWDNDYEYNSYAHIAMTERDVASSLSTVKIDDDFLPFSATSINEFNEMINRVLDNKKRRRIKEDKEQEEQENKKVSKKDIEIHDLIDFKGYFSDFFKRMEKIFPKEFNALVEKYPCISPKNVFSDIYSLSYLPQDFLEGLYEIAKLIVSKNNNSISDEVLRSAIEEVYKDVYEGRLKKEDLDKMFKDTEHYRTVEFIPSK